MRPRRLTGLERTKIEEELAESAREDRLLQADLADENLLKQVHRGRAAGDQEEVLTPRAAPVSRARPRISRWSTLIAEENMVVTMTKAGYMRRGRRSTYRQQKRGGRGHARRELEGRRLRGAPVLWLPRTLYAVLLHAGQGGLPPEGVRDPEAGRHARGTAIVNLLPLEKGESISAVIATKDFWAEEFSCSPRLRAT